ncbi:MAG: hypothetical protein FWF70_00140 [Bacteroidetes bacterium]|nr:hypothetical protein [Bacteroidota bacterium]MCL1969358.1 hypothetical protein [Bacteroidota bacterium]
MSTLLKYLKVFAILIASFFAFSVLSCLIPGKCVQKNIEKSLPELLEEGNYPKVILKGKQYMQDNFTDALILNIVVSSGFKPPVQSAMENTHFSQYPDDTVFCYTIKHLDYKLKNMDLSPNGIYSRYWFGSAAVCRILLLIMNYQDIKWLFCIVSTLLLLIFAVKIVNKAGWIKSLPLFLALLFANFFVTQFSIQFFPVIAIALIGGIIMCDHGQKPIPKLSMHLFVIGMFTAYFDLLTTPLLTLGLPLLVYMILQSEEDKSMGKILISISILCLSWLIGFACAWTSKWGLAAVFTDSNAIGAMDAIIWRITDRGSRWSAIVRNVTQLPLVWLNTVLCVYLLLTFLNFNKKRIKWAIAFLIVGLFPYIWYFILSGHSIPHWWFTYRLQILSMGSVMSALVALIDWERLNSKLKTIRAFFTNFTTK